MAMLTGTALALATLAVSAGAAGYGVYAGERAKAAAANQYNQARQDAQQNRQSDLARAAQEKADSQALYDKQVADQNTTNASLKAQQDASLTDIRSKIPGMTNQLGADLLAQQEHAYTRMAPKIEGRLNALGLLQSGALPEAQAKAQGDLESQRQAALASFRQNADNTLNIQQPLANTQADIGRQSDALGRNLQTQQNNLSQQFATNNTNSLNNVAQQQYLAGLASANNAAAQSSANSYMNLGGQIGGAGLQYYGSTQKPQTNTNPNLDALQYQRKMSDFYGAGNSGPVNWRR